MKEKTYNKEVYNYSILSKAITDYNHLAKILISNSGNEWKCSFSSDTIPLDLLILEFDNYLIELSQLHIKV